MSFKSISSNKVNSKDTLLAPWICVLSLGWLASCLPVDETDIKAGYIETPSSIGATAMANLPPTSAPEPWLTYISEQAGNSYGVFEIAIGCLLDDMPCLGEPTMLFAVDPTTSNISWSPNGQQASFAAHGAGGMGDIYVIDWDGKNLVNITQSSSVYEDFPAWSPDGDRIAYEACVESGCTLMSSQPDGSNASPFLKPTHLKSPRLVAWSPDGQRIAFVADQAATGLAQVYVANLDGSALVQLTDVPTGHLSPAFSGDGTWVSFVRDTDLDSLSNSGIFRIHPDGTEESVVIIGQIRRQLSQVWHPLYNWIAFDGTFGVNYDIYLVKPDGSGLVKVTNSETTDEFSPAWRWSARP